MTKQMHVACIWHRFSNPVNFHTYHATRTKVLVMYRVPIGIEPHQWSPKMAPARIAETVRLKISALPGAAL